MASFNSSPLITEEILGAVSDAELRRTKRKEAQAHYTLEIESIDRLSEILPKSPLDRYESAQFEAAGYQWRLILYPGNPSKGDGNFISLYLKLEDVRNGQPEREVDALLKFFIFIHAENQFECIQDGRLRRFNAVKREWGFSQLCDLSKGYQDDQGRCKFGVEVFVVKGQGKGECFSVHDKPSSQNYYTWNWTADLKRPAGNAGDLFSDVFPLVGHKWKLHLYPKGVPKVKKQFLSIFLWLEDDYDKLIKMYVEFKIQVEIFGEIKEKAGTAWFTTSDTKWGFPYFMELADPEGLTIDEILVVAEITPISIITDLSEDVPKVQKSSSSS